MRISLLLIATLCLGAAALLEANLSGSPAGYTGAPAEQTCAAAGCHEGADTVAAPRLDLRLFRPYTDTVVIRVILGEGDAGFQTDRVGFQAVVLNSQFQPVGEVIPEDSIHYRVDTSQTSGRIYVSQTDSGGMAKPVTSGAIAYQFEWVRQASTDSGMLYAAALWADGDGTRFNDALVCDSVRLYPCDIILTGDVNQSRAITSADVIYSINYVFKGGEAPRPCEASGDVNCDGKVTSSDVIATVNYVFKDFWFCDVCPLIWDGVWTCE